MSPAEVSGPEPFWKTVRLIWKSARRRVVGRAERQRQVMRQRKGRSSDFPAGLAIVVMALVSAFLHGFLGRKTAEFVQVGAVVATERAGKMVVSDRMWEHLAIPDQKRKNVPSPTPPPAFGLTGTEGAPFPWETQMTIGRNLRHDFARDTQRSLELRDAFWVEAERRANLLGSTAKEQDQALWENLPSARAGRFR